MAIPYNLLPFKVTFYQQEIIPVDLFCETEEEAHAVTNPVEIKENKPLNLTFEAPEGTRLYMDGLDTLPTHEAIRVDEDRGEIYLTPCNDLPFLKNEYYPLIPSRNLMTVVVGDKTYHAVIKVVASQLTETGYQIMVDDLERLAKGLSMDLIRKNLGLGYYFKKPIPPIILYRFMVIQKHFRSVMAALNDLVEKVNHRVKNEYYMEPIEKAKRIDSITIRYRLTRQENEEMLKVPKRVIDYDLLENQWTKKIVKQLVRYISEFVAAVNGYIQEVELVIEYQSKYAKFQESTKNTIEQERRVLKTLEDYSETALKMERSLRIIKTAAWYDEISEPSLTVIPYGLMHDARYFALFRLYKELQKEDFELALDPAYAYQYKRTDKLYETWGFLKICDVLKNKPLNFKPNDGWIYEKELNLTDNLIPTLLSGSSIVLTKGDLRLKVVYDGKLPLKGETNLSNPVYIESKHRRPDGRIDVYKNEVFIGSIIFDLKYRNSYSVFYETSHYGDPYSAQTHDQLLSYATACRSPYIHGSKNAFLLANLGVVPEVWVFFPKGSDTLRFRENEKVKFIKLVPGSSTEFLVERMEKTITSMIDGYQEGGF